MSFIRLSKSDTCKNFRKTKKIAKTKPKPEWDSTIQDLDVYRASAEEVAYRKAMHQSKHVMKEHLVDGDRNRARDGKRGVNPQQAAVIKELLLDRQQLQDVLSRSDQMLEVVKDMFGDNPKRYTGFPNVTTAPGSDQQYPGGELVGNVPELSTRMEALSQSVMDDTALNDDIDEGGGALVYTSKMDLARFRQFLATQEVSDPSLSTIYPPTHNGSDIAGLMQSITMVQDSARNSQSIADGSMFCTPPREHNESIALLRTPPSAVNDTKKVNRTKPVHAHQVTHAHQPVHAPQPLMGVSYTPPANATVAAPNMQEPVNSRPNTSAFSSDLQKVITNLDTELSTLEHSSPPRTRSAFYNAESFSGYTAVLVNAVTKLTRHLKQIDVQLKAEALVREQLAENVQDLRALVDALTGDLITTQEEYAHVLQEFGRYKQSMESQQNHIVSCLKSVGLWKPMEPAPPQVPQSAVCDGGPTTMLPSQEDNIMTLPQPVTPADVLPSPHLDRIQLAARAVLLSPPVQKSRLLHNPPKPKAASDHTAAAAQNPLHPPAVVTVPKPASLVHHDTRHLTTLIRQAQDFDAYLSQNSGGPPVSVSSSECDSIRRPYRDFTDQRLHYDQIIATDPRCNMDQRWITTDVNIKQTLAANQQSPLDSTDNGNQRVNRDAAATVYGDTRVNLNHERVELASQIAELNRQHEEAERRLESLMTHQWTLESQSGISPSMSSISQHTLDATHQPPPSILPKTGAPRQSITVALPSAELDASIVSPA